MCLWRYSVLVGKQQNIDKSECSKRPDSLSWEELDDHLSCSFDRLLAGVYVEAIAIQRHKLFAQAVGHMRPGRLYFRHMEVYYTWKEAAEEMEPASLKKRL